MGLYIIAGVHGFRISLFTKSHCVACIALARFAFSARETCQQMVVLCLLFLSKSGVGIPSPLYISLAQYIYDSARVPSRFTRHLKSCYLLGSQSDEVLKLIGIHLRLESVQLSVLPRLLVFGWRANHSERQRTTDPNRRWLADSPLAK